MENYLIMCIKNKEWNQKIYIALNVNLENLQS